MKFLIDAQLPPGMCGVLQKTGYDAMHMELLPKGDESSDRDITMYADDHGLMVVIKDSDFYYSHMVLNQPQKLFLVTTGNINNRDLFSLIRKNASVIKDLVNKCSYIEMSNEEIFGH